MRTCAGAPVSPHAAARPTQHAAAPLLHQQQSSIHHAPLALALGCLPSPVLQVTQKLQLMAQGKWVDEEPEERRSPSPEPVYNEHGARTNTREQRAKDKLTRQRNVSSSCSMWGLSVAGCAQVWAVGRKEQRTPCMNRTSAAAVCCVVSRSVSCVDRPSQTENLNLLLCWPRACMPHADPRVLQELITELIKASPTFKPPADYKPEKKFRKWVALLLGQLALIVLE